MRRRELLTGVVGLTVAATLPAGRASAAPDIDPAPVLSAALFQPHGEPAASSASLDRHVVAVQQLFRAARYSDLARQLPPLIVTARASRDAWTGQAREQACAALSKALSLAAELCVKRNEGSLAAICADRAVTAAGASGDPLLLAEATRTLAITMRRAGHPTQAVDLLTATAERVREEHRGDDVGLAAYGSLMLTASYTAAAARNNTALDLAAEAEQAAARLRKPVPAAIIGNDFTPAQCALYRIGTHHVLGDDAGALTHAGRLRPEHLPTPERRARLFVDLARVYEGLGKPGKTFEALRAVEVVAPQEVRRPALRALTANLLYSPGSLPGLRDFAVRTGAVTG